MDPLDGDTVFGTPFTFRAGEHPQKVFIDPAQGVAGLMFRRAEAKDDDGEAFEKKMDRLTKDLSEQLAEGRRLEEEIRKNLGVLGYEL